MLHTLLGTQWCLHWPLPSRLVVTVALWLNQSQVCDLDTHGGQSGQGLVEG